MEITIDLPETTLRKVKAFGVLCGGGGADIETTLIGLIDSSVSSAIIDHLGGVSVPDMAPQETTPRTARQVVRNTRRDVDSYPDHSGITSGLGDEDEEDVNATSAEDAFVPKRGGLTEQDMEEDMMVSDPDHEAKVDAPPMPKGRTMPQPPAEELFSVLGGLPPPPVVDPRAASRKKQLKSKARVTYATGADA